jgi:hypothetical protein
MPYSFACPGIDTQVEGISILRLLQRTRQLKAHFCLPKDAGYHLYIGILHWDFAYMYFYIHGCMRSSIWSSFVNYGGSTPLAGARSRIVL